MGLYQKIDDDNSGSIDVAEFIAFVKKEGDPMLHQMLMIFHALHEVQYGTS